VQRRQNLTRIALMFSLILHLAVLLTLRGVIFLRAASEILDSVQVDLIRLPDSATETLKRIPKRELEPIRKIRSLSVETPSKGITADKLPKRTITPKITDKNKEAEILNVDTSIKVKPSLSSPLTSTSTLGASGTSSQGRGMGDRSGTGIGGSGHGGLISVDPRKVRTDGSIAEKFQVYSEADLPFVKALQEIAQHVLDMKSSRKVDITFIIDKSGSMQNDIDAVRRHLNGMVDRFRQADLDFTLGVVSFHHSLVYEWLGMDISISQQTADVEQIRKILRSMKVSGGERALDALMKAIDKVKFRSGADRHFILITDEYVRGTYPVQEVLRAAKRARITIDVIGRNEPFQRTIAEQTGGIWMSIKDIRGEK
jgi:Mg-chelatase subunit ChlD